MYNLQFPSDPEQIFRIDSLFNEESSLNTTTVKFTFGSKAGIWSPFTIYLLMENNSLFSLCPIIPYNALISSSYLNEPFKLASSSLDQIYSSRSSVYNQNLIDYYESQIEWIQDVKGSTVVSENNYSNKSSSDSNWIRTKSSNSRCSLKLQGPLKTLNSSGDSNLTTIVDIQSINTFPQILLKIDTFSNIEVLVLFEEILPLWDSSSSSIGITDTPGLILLERIELNISKEGSTLPTLIQDVNRIDTLYIINNTSIFRLYLHWLDKFSRSCVDGSINADSVLDLISPSLTENLLVSATSSDAIKSYVFINSSSIGYLILVINQNKQCSIVYLDVGMVNLNSLFSTISSTTTSSPSSSEIVPFESQLESIIKNKRLSALPTLTGSPPIHSVEALDILIKSAHKLQQDYVNFIYNLHTEIVSRLDLLEKVKIQNDTLLNEALSLFNVAQQNSVKLVQKFEKTFKFHQILIKRIETILQILHTKNEGLSPAERMFHKQLNQTQSKLPLYNSRIIEVIKIKYKKNFKIKATKSFK